MRRHLLLTLVTSALVACSSKPRMTVPAPPATGATVTVDAAVEVVAVPDAAVEQRLALPTIPYRTDKSDFDIEPAVAGTGKTFMVVAEDVNASKAGQAILAAGGNAVDAAVATAFALAVSRPQAGNIGGGGFAVVRTKKGTVGAIDFRETAPAAATPDMFKDDNETTRMSLVGAKAVGTPGSVAGLWAMHKKWGKKPWKDLVAPAIALAKDGYKVDKYLASDIKRRQTGLGLSGEFAARFTPNGKPLEEGATVLNPELAVVLQRIADKGPDGFYKGDTAKTIAKAMKEQGGLITEKDLASYKIATRVPISFTYRNKKIWTMPPPSSGGMVLALTANMLRNQDLSKLGWHSVDHVRWLVEVWRRGYAARNMAFGDPAFVKNMPIKKLTSQAEADRLVKTVGDKATPSQDVPKIIEGTDTTNLVVVDGKGMAVAITTTINTRFGSGMMVDGILMNNEMDDFATRPGQPNTFGLVQGAANKVEPGKRMLSSMSPTVVEDDKGELFMVVGAQGGPRIITSVWQTLSNVIDFGMTADAAVSAPRLHHQHLPDDVVFEDEAISQQTEQGLTERGYKVVWLQADRIAASANAIVKTATGWAGSADYRGGGAALGD
jgi:gamma-glutamyltranspeptidase / glutathione hydrolase